MVEDKYIALIQKEATEGLSASERAELKAWLDRDASHPALYAEIQAVWTLADDYSVAVPIDADAEFAEIQAKIKATQNEAPKSERQVRRLPLRWMAMAASFLIIAGYFWRQYSPGPDRIHVVASADNQVIDLPDGSTVQLEKGASVSYIPDWSEGRSMSFNGAGYFHITSNPEKPLRIEGEGSTVTVLGTQFIYHAMADTGYVQLIEGKVRLTHADQAVLLQGSDAEAAAYGSGKITRRHIDAGYYPWYQHRFKYSEAPLAKVVSDMEQWYDRFISIPDHLKSCTFTGDISDQGIRQVLETLALVYGAELVQKEESFTFEGGSCL